MKKQIKRIISLLFSFLVLSIFFTGQVNAAGEGKITITFEYEIDQNGSRKSVAIPNATFDVYQIWEGSENIVFLDPFLSLYTAEEVKSMTSEELQKKAEEFEKRITPSAILTSGNTDANGKLEINNLNLGGYLIVQREAKQVNGEYYLAKSFLVTIPYEGVGHVWTNEVDIKPKASLLMSPEISKLVNNVELYGLNAKEEIFTYSITTTMPTIPAGTFKVTDKLEHVLEFANYTNAHDIVTVSINGSPLTDTQIDNQTDINKDQGKISITFTQEQLDDFRGNDVVITFKAKIKKDASLLDYVSGRVPNQACYVVNYASANARKNTKTVSLSDERKFYSSMGMIEVHYLLEPQNKCSNIVHVYVKDKPTKTPTPTPTPRINIPPTIAYLMNQMEENPWMLIVVALVAFIIARRAYVLYNKTDK